MSPNSSPFFSILGEIRTSGGDFLTPGLRFIQRAVSQNHSPVSCDGPECRNCLCQCQQKQEVASRKRAAIHGLFDVRFASGYVVSMLAAAEMEAILPQLV